MVARDDCEKLPGASFRRILDNHRMEKACLRRVNLHRLDTFQRTCLQRLIYVMPVVAVGASERRERCVDSFCCGGKLSDGHSSWRQIKSRR